MESAGNSQKKALAGTERANLLKTHFRVIFNLSINCIIFVNMDFTYNISNKGTYAIVEMSGNLVDKNQATPLLDEIQSMIENGITSFVISMENFRYMNSNGLNVLVNILTKSRKNGGDTTICSVSDKIKELLIITKLNTVFTITEDLPAAVRQFQNQSQ